MGVKVGEAGPVALAVKRIFLIAFLVVTGVALLVFVGLLALVGGHPRQMENVMAGALVEGLLLGGAFVGFVTFERPWLRLFSVTGWLLTGLMLAAFPAFVWYDSMRTYYAYDRVFSNLAGTGMLAAMFFNLVPVVFLPRMNFVGRAIQGVSVGSLSLAAVVLLVMIWNLFGYDPTIELALGATFGLGIAGALAVFALSKFSLLKAPDPVSAVATTLRLFCPRCGQSQELPLGESACSACQLKFSIDVEEPRCPRCHYNLHKLEATRCPECGQAIVTDAAAAPA